MLQGYQIQHIDVTQKSFCSAIEHPYKKALITGNFVGPLTRNLPFLRNKE